MPENPFWDYSLAHYAKPGVAQCCLDYQDQHGANVNLLLLCCWLGSLGRTITSEQLEQAKLTIESIDLHIVQPLREARQFIKISKPSANDLYCNLKQVELVAEQIVQNDLYSWSMRNGVIRDKKLMCEKELISVKAVSATQLKNLNTYLSLLDCDAITATNPLCSGND